MSGANKNVWIKSGNQIQREDMIDVFDRWKMKAERNAWIEFYNGWVYFEDGDAYLRYEWMHNFMGTIVEEHKKRGYIFIYNFVSMKRKMMLWLYELADAARVGREPIIPALHKGHRNCIDDFTEYDYLFNYSNFWVDFVKKWATCDMLDNYADKLGALLPLFLYAHIDTTKSSTIIAADELKNAIERAILEEEEENNGRRLEYQDSGYYKGNKEYL
jgi:hypothetical protein